MTINVEDTERPVLLANSVYRVELVEWKKHWLFRMPKLVMVFALVDSGEHNGALLKAYYNVEWTGDAFRAGWKSYFCRDYQHCFGQVNSIESYDMKRFKDVIVKAEVTTVITDAEDRELSPVNQYSRISRLVGICDRN